MSTDERATCSKCGTEYAISEWPWCPHGKPSQIVIPDDIPGGETVENMGHEPVTYYSKSERRRLMKEHGVEEFVRHQPTKGSDKSPYTVSWDKGSIDAQTLQNAADLLDPARRRRSSGADPALPFTRYPVTVRELPGD